LAGRDAQFATGQFQCSANGTFCGDFAGRFAGTVIAMGVNLTSLTREIAPMLDAETTFPAVEIASPPIVTNTSVAASPAPPVIYSSAELLQGRREVWIEHGDQMYRLRVTSAKKLYLTK
jgi:hemin uptake protein HemP